MPDPATLAAYDKALPGSAERILRAFESVTVDASARDDRISDAGIWIRKVGTGWAIFILLTLVGFGVAFFFLGNLIAGCTLLGVPLVVAIVSIVTSAIDRS